MRSKIRRDILAPALLPRFALPLAALAGLVLAVSSRASAEPAAPKAPAVRFEDGFPTTRADALYPVSKVEVGQRGIGYTVFDGPSPRPFDVEILGIMRSMLGPNRDVILARLSGPEIEKSGVIAGMSGSPVYVDGKLLGAVAYRFGSFTREPIAGITPIESMLDLTRDPQLDHPLGPAASVGPRGATLAPVALRAALLRSREPPTLASWLERGGLVPFEVRPGSSEAARAAGLVLGGARPIATPIAVSGLGAGAERFLGELLGADALVVAGGGSGASGSAKTGLQPNIASRAGGQVAPPIRPAAPISAVLMRGDLNVSGTGTVSYVDGPLVLAFGHPFFGFGKVSFPLATAAILNTLASAAGSYKQSALGLEVGAITADRLTAIGGHLGEKAPLVPVRITVTPHDRRGKPLVTEVEITRHELWLPVMLSSAIQSASNGRIAEEAGGGVDLVARLYVGDRVVELRDGYSVPAPNHPAALAAQDVGIVASLIARNGLQIADLSRVEVELRTRPEVELTVLEDAVLLTPAVKAGGLARVEVRLHAYRGPVERVRLELPVPRDADGELELLVGGAAELDVRDDTVLGDRVFDDLDDLLALLVERRPGRGLHARLYLKRNGLRSGSELMSALPPSQRLLLEDRVGSRVRATTEALGPALTRPTSAVVVGSATLKLQVTR